MNLLNFDEYAIPAEAGETIIHVGSTKIRIHRSEREGSLYTWVTVSPQDYSEHGHHVTWMDIEYPLSQRAYYGMPEMLNEPA